MLKLLTFVTSLAPILTVSSVAAAATITFQAFPKTGEIRVVNTDAAPFEFIFYSIHSQSAGLNGSSAVWNSISGNFDVNGDGSIDPDGEWRVFGSRGPFQLTEGTFGAGGTLAPYSFLPLGPIWSPGSSPATDLTIQVVQADNEFADVNFVLAIDGDYNGDLVVDGSDYELWKSSFGSTSTPLVDGNLSGVVDAADYTVWRDHLGASLLLGSAAATSAALAAAVVPEPASVLFALVALTTAPLASARRRWSTCRPTT